MSVEIRKYHTDNELDSERHELRRDRVSAWFRHYMDPMLITGVMVEGGAIKVVKGRLESADDMQEADDGSMISMELAEANIDELLAGDPHLVEAIGKHGDRIMVQLTNLGEMGEHDTHPGMQAAWN